MKVLRFTPIPEWAKHEIERDPARRKDIIKAVHVTRIFENHWRWKDEIFNDGLV